MDLCSCGIDAKNAKELEKFHEGPSFLSIDPSEWDTWVDQTEPEEGEVNGIRVLAVKTKDENNSLDQCVNKYLRLLKIGRVLTWCWRSATNATAKTGGYKPTVGELAAEEMLMSLTCCIKRAQELESVEEICA